MPIGHRRGDTSFREARDRAGQILLGKQLTDDWSHAIECRDIKANLYNDTERLGKQGNKLSVISAV